MDKILDKLIDLNISYSVISYGDYSYIVLYMPYFPFDFSASPGMAQVDNYFYAYQKMRGARDETIKHLCENGFEADSNVDISYKLLAAQTGKAVILKNTLVAFENMGSFVVLEAIRVKGNYGNLPGEVRKNELCAVCGLCRKSCPTSSISDEGFIRNTCLRDVQQRGDNSDEEVMRAMGERIIGCNTCQRVCPANRNAVYKIPDEIEKELFDLHNLFLCAKQGKKGLLKYDYFLGSNYLRPARLLTLCVNAMMNKRDFSLADEVRELKDYRDGRVRLAAERFIEKLNETEN